MTRRVERLLLLVFLVVAPILAACGGGGASDPASGDSSSSPALAVGDVAPDFTAQEADGGQIALSGALQEADTVVLVFYRGVF